MWRGLAYGLLPKAHLAGGQEWIGRWRAEARERPPRLQSCCELLGRKGLMLDLSLEVVIPLAVVLKQR